MIIRFLMLLAALALLAQCYSPALSPGESITDLLRRVLQGVGR